MNPETSAPAAEVPVKAPEPAEAAPPMLAEPASGPVAEMSGALPTQPAPSTKPAEPTVTATTNGPVDTPAAVPTETQESAPPAEGDAEMKDAEAETAEPEANGTPATSKGGPRRKSSGIPEHKGKKLNKKKSMNKITHLDAQPGEYFLARLKGYPPWPSIICDEEILPTALINSRPVTAKKEDGTYNEAYADGGKKVAERTFPIMFLGTNEFGWFPNTDLTPLNPEDCKDAPEKGKSKALIAAYQIAAEGHDLPHWKEVVAAHAAAVQQEEDDRAEAQAAKEAAKAAKAERAEKKKRKSEVKPAADDDVEMEDADGEPKKSAKKRKKEVESDDEDLEKPAKTPKATKLKLTTNKTPVTTEKKSKDKPVKSRAERRKSKLAASDEEMADAAEEVPEEKPLDPVEARKAREKEVLYLRHKLQKGFLSRDQAPQEEEMPQMAGYIEKLEVYKDLEVSTIRNTKINKVLKALVKLNTIPRDEEFRFKQRALDLLSHWNKVLGSDVPEAEGATADKDKATPTTNGVHDEKADQDAAPATGDKLSEPAEEKMEAPAPAPVAGESKPEPASEKPIEEPKAAEVLKTDAPAPATTDKAPQSATAAAEVAEVVKASE